MKFIAPIIFIGTALVIVFTFIQPMYQDIAILNARAAQFDEALNRSAELQQIRERLATKYQNFDPIDVGRLMALLPDNIDNVRLILEADDIARAYKMRIHDISVVNEDVKTPQNGRGAVATEPADDQDYEKVTISFSTEGSYKDFLLFLTDIERSLRLVDISTLSVSAEPDTDVLTYNISLVTYWLK
ncbi:MAG TPA: hypothetical protein VJH21_01195 [Candidatus Paceibacterota bacterium]